MYVFSSFTHPDLILGFCVWCSYIVAFYPGHCHTLHRDLLPVLLIEHWFPYCILWSFDSTFILRSCCHIMFTWYIQSYLKGNLSCLLIEFIVHTHWYFSYVISPSCLQYVDINRCGYFMLVLISALNGSDAWSLYFLASLPSPPKIPSVHSLLSFDVLVCGLNWKACQMPTNHLLK